MPANLKMISVRAVEGRVAYDAPRGGNRIPHDKFVSVPHTNYIERLLNGWGDIEKEGKASVSKADDKPAAKKE